MTVQLEGILSRWLGTPRRSHQHLPEGGYQPWALPGGILLRVYLKDNVLPNLGRVVMISPPNRGSELVDRLGTLSLFRFLHGPAGLQLGTGPGSLPLRLPAVEFELGIIAGDRSLLPLYSWWIPGPDDGIVAVERTKVEGMKDFIVLPHSHTFIMRSERTLAQILRFLRTGSFDHEESEEEESS